MPPSLLKLHHRSYPSLLIVWFTILCQGKTAKISINHILGFVQIQFPRLIWWTSSHHQSLCQCEVWIDFCDFMQIYPGIFKIWIKYTTDPNISQDIISHSHHLSLSGRSLGKFYANISWDFQISRYHQSSPLSLSQWEVSRLLWR